MQSAQDRRVCERLRLAVPLVIEHPEWGTGITFDVCEWGARVLCDHAYAVGEFVRLILPANKGSGDARRLSGEIVRVVSLSEDLGRWSHAFAVEFDEPLEDAWR